VDVCPSTSKSPQTQIVSLLRIAILIMSTAFSISGKGVDGVASGCKNASAASGELIPRRSRVCAMNGGRFNEASESVFTE